MGALQADALGQRQAGLVMQLQQTFERLAIIKEYRQGLLQTWATQRSLSYDFGVLMLSRIRSLGRSGRPTLIRCPNAVTHATSISLTLTQGFSSVPCFASGILDQRPVLLLAFWISVLFFFWRCGSASWFSSGICGSASCF